MCIVRYQIHFIILSGRCNWEDVFSALLGALPGPNTESVEDVWREAEWRVEDIVRDYQVG